MGKLAADAVAAASRTPVRLAYFDTLLLADVFNMIFSQGMGHAPWQPWQHQ